MSEKEIYRARLDGVEDYGRRLMDSSDGIYSGEQLRNIGKNIVLLSARNPPKMIVDGEPDAE